ncbi:sugar kinase [Streptacidiphilus sp. PB12-B1b]|uniref:sugar kinase n=1 Tax=Streptacidiphilus sp. PB12-B1b TaxID=2705012 RepID=UPI0015F95A26|nr:sugar kinase [Streptacidiphilus sp. PB12-B1b]QMU77640.1 sugar kinase [Streptacidiphilus sp. PB12-B1b]
MSADGLERTGLLTFGETMGLVSALDTGPLEYARGFGYGIGGAESNVAIGVSRLGAPAAWFGRVGADATGDLVERRLRGEEVRTLAIRDGGFTGIMVKHRRFGTTLQVDYHRAGSAGSRLAPADVPAELVGTAAILHVTGITPALSESAAAAVRHALQLARAGGTTVSVDVNYRSKLWSRTAAGPVLRELVSLADIVFAGVEEAELVAGSGESAPTARTAAELAQALAALGPSEAVVKDGARGCTAVVDGVRYRLPALPVTVVDPTGAGDAFVAGYLAEHLGGATAEQRLRTAIAAGAFAVTVPGDCEGLPRRADLAALARPEEDIAR